MGNALAGSSGSEFLLNEGRAPGVGGQLGGDQFGVSFQASPRVGAGPHGRHCCRGPCISVGGSLAELSGLYVESFRAERERQLVGVGAAFGLVACLELLCPFLVVVTECDERVV